MPTLISPLDAALTYVWCPQCASTGNPRSPLVRDGSGMISCSFGHRPTADQLAASDMVKFGEVFKEQPSPTDIKWPIFVNPQVKAKLESRFPQNLMITIGTLLAALADGSVLILMGDEVKKLKDKGIKNGKDMLATLEMVDTVSKERQMLMDKIEQYERIFKQAGVGG